MAQATSNQRSRGGWPERLFLSFPRHEAPYDLAAAVRSAIGARLRQPLLNFDALADAGRFQISETVLSAADGGCEAMIAPASGNRFHIWVDPATAGGADHLPSPVQDDLRRHRLRFRIAHEIGHSFFFDRRGDCPIRRFPGSDAEEWFCDEFARSLLVPEAAASSCALSVGGLLELQRRYDVSFEVAARAIAHAHRDQIHVALFYRRPDHSRWKLQWTDAEAEQFGRSLLRSKVTCAAERRGRADGEARVTLAGRVRRARISAHHVRERHQLVVFVAPR